MSSPPSNRVPEVPPEIAFVSLPKPLAQFHHLPPHVPVWIHRQEEIEKKGYDFTEGVRVMEELLKEAPGVPGAYLYQLFTRKWPRLMQVNPYFASGRIAEAIPKLVEILDIDPECPLTCFQLGFCFRATGELERSESFYKKALRMAPDAGWIYSNLGRTYRSMGDGRRAAETFWKALELLPDDRFVMEQLVELGELFVIPQKDKGDGISAAFVKRVDYEKKAEEIIEKEGDPAALAKMGWRLLQDHLNDLACRCFEKALQGNKAPLESRLGLGIAYLEAGRYPEAEKSLTEYLDADPSSAAAHLNLFKVYLAQEEKDLAWDEIQTAVRLDPSRMDALRQLYLLYRETGRMEEGLEWMDQLSAENPSLFAPILLKAQALTEQDRWPEAELSLKDAAGRFPGNEEILLFYSAELGKRGRAADLIALLREAPGPLPLSLTINLALAFSQAGKSKEGRQVLVAFLERPGLPLLEAERAKAVLREFEKEG